LAVLHAYMPSSLYIHDHHSIFLLQLERINDHNLPCTAFNITALCEPGNKRNPVVAFSYRCKWHDANSFVEENDQAPRSAIWVVLPAEEDKFIWATSYSYSGEAPQLVNLSTWILNRLSLRQSFVRTSWTRVGEEEEECGGHNAL